MLKGGVGGASPMLKGGWSLTNAERWVGGWSLTNAERWVEPHQC